MRSLPLERTIRRRLVPFEDHKWEEVIGPLVACKECVEQMQMHRYVIRVGV